MLYSAVQGLRVVVGRDRCLVTRTPLPLNPGKIIGQYKYHSQTSPRAWQVQHSVTVESGEVEGLPGAVVAACPARSVIWARDIPVQETIQLALQVLVSTGSTTRKLSRLARWSHWAGVRRAARVQVSGFIQYYRSECSYQAR